QTHWNVPQGRVHVDDHSNPSDVTIQCIRKGRGATALERARVESRICPRLLVSHVIAIGGWNGDLVRHIASHLNDLSPRDADALQHEEGADRELCEPGDHY